MIVNVTDNHAQRLARMAPDRIIGSLGEQLGRSAVVLMRDAQHSLDDGAISGSGHIPSLPGEPPNTDTGQLRDSGFVSDVVETGNEVRTAAGFDAPYAGYLEFGTSRMHERPFLGPATERVRPSVLTGLVYRFRELVGLR